MIRFHLESALFIFLLYLVPFLNLNRSEDEYLSYTGAKDQSMYLIKPFLCENIYKDFTIFILFLLLGGHEIRCAVSGL